MAGAHRVKQSRGAKGKGSKETKGATTFCQTHGHLPSFRTSLPEAGDNSYCLVHRCIYRLVMICAFQGRETTNGSRRKINFTETKWKSFHYTQTEKEMAFYLVPFVLNYFKYSLITCARRSDRAARSHSQHAMADSITDSSNRWTGEIQRFCSSWRSASFDVTSSAVIRNSMHFTWPTSDKHQSKMSSKVIVQFSNNSGT